MENKESNLRAETPVVKCQIKSQGFTSGLALQTKIEQDLTALITKYSVTCELLTVHINKESSGFTTNIVMQVRRYGNLQAKSTDYDVYQSVSSAITHLAKQIRRNKRYRNTMLRQEGSRPS